MPERTNIPASPACGQWETLLADALDGLLSPQDEAKFAAHKAVCPACAALYDEARKGREWLEFLGPEPEAPLGLLEKMVQGALAHVSPELREAVILRDLQDMDYKEIAQVLGIPEGTVKSRISRGRAELARLLERNKREVM